MIQETPKNNVLEEGKVNLPYSMIKENLALPIPETIIRTRPQGNIDIEYVNVTDLKDLLDIRAGIWSSEIVFAQQMGNQFCVVLKITIYAVDFNVSHDGNGHDDINIDTYGDSFSNAYAQAFRRACESHGLGREMWRKSESRPSAQRQRQTQPSQNTQQALPQSNYNSAPAGSPASEKQLKYIVSLCVEKGLDEVKLAKERFDTKFEEINKTMASDLIKYVTNYKP